VFSPDDHLLALCYEVVVHIKDLIEPPPRHPENNAGIKSRGRQDREGTVPKLARVRHDGTRASEEDIVQTLV
jgi:hypothetical protein